MLSNKVIKPYFPRTYPKKETTQKQLSLFRVKRIFSKQISEYFTSIPTHTYRKDVSYKDLKKYLTKNTIKAIFQVNNLLFSRRINNNLRELVIAYT